MQVIGSKPARAKVVARLSSRSKLQYRGQEIAGIDTPSSTISTSSRVPAPQERVLGAEEINLGLRLIKRYLIEGDERSRIDLATYTTLICESDTGREATTVDDHA
jgi:hypothetical protein